MSNSTRFDAREDLLGKFCKVCHKYQWHDEFTLISKAGTKRDARCKACVRAAQRANPKKYLRNLEWDKKQRDSRTQWGRYRIAYLRSGTHARRVLAAGAESDKMTIADLLVRDERICQICGSLIPLDAAWPDPLSPSIDHIVPISKGGTHTFGNVQSAHLRCNMLKGDRTA